MRGLVEIGFFCVCVVGGKEERDTQKERRGGARDGDGLEMAEGCLKHNATNDNLPREETDRTKQDFVLGLQCSPKAEKAAKPNGKEG